MKASGSQAFIELSVGCRCFGCFFFKFIYSCIYFHIYWLILDRGAMFDVEPFASCFLNLSAAHLPLFTSPKKTLNWLWNRLLLSEALPAAEFLRSSFILPRRYGAVHLDRMVYKMYSFILLWLFVGLLLMLNGASYPDPPSPNPTTGQCDDVLRVEARIHDFLCALLHVCFFFAVNFCLLF